MCKSLSISTKVEENVRKSEHHMVEKEVVEKEVRALILKSRKKHKFLCEKIQLRYI